jgi:hypothetical protein
LNKHISKWNADHANWADIRGSKPDLWKKLAEFAPYFEKKSAEIPCIRVIRVLFTGCTVEKKEKNKEPP